jgi:hypothetical protein
MAVGHDDPPTAGARGRSFERLHVGEIAMRPAPDFDVKGLETHRFLTVHAKHMQTLERRESGMAKGAILHGRIVVARQSDHIPRRFGKKRSGAFEHASWQTIVIKCVASQQQNVDRQTLRCADHKTQMLRPFAHRMGGSIVVDVDIRCMKHEDVAH